MSQTTLAEWLTSKVHTGAISEALASIIGDIGAACVELSNVLRDAPANGLVGALTSVNVQGETQKQLDVIANDIFVKELEANASVVAMVSEELEEAVHLERNGDGERYGVLFDPLDGSSNLDVNVTVGSIFSIIPVAGDTVEDLLLVGDKQVAAGYAAYGPSTSLVLSFGKSVDVFTLNSASGKFEMSQQDLRVAPAAAEFAINTARYRFWDAPTRAYVDACVAGETGPFEKRYNMRWVGSMVADIHRILMRGGIFMYPSDSETVAKGGRLRLLYEASPMSFIVEAAGGGASTGKGRLLEVAPNAIHQRVPVILGSIEEVQKVEAFYRS